MGKPQPDPRGPFQANAKGEPGSGVPFQADSKAEPEFGCWSQLPLSQSYTLEVRRGAGPAGTLWVKAAWPPVCAGSTPVLCKDSRDHGIEGSTLCAKVSYTWRGVLRVASWRPGQHSLRTRECWNGDPGLRIE